MLCVSQVSVRGGKFWGHSAIEYRAETLEAAEAALSCVCQEFGPLLLNLMHLFFIFAHFCLQKSWV